MTTGPLSALSAFVDQKTARACLGQILDAMGFRRSPDGRFFGRNGKRGVVYFETKGHRISGPWSLGDSSRGLKLSSIVSFVATDDMGQQVFSCEKPAEFAVWVRANCTRLATI